MSKTFGGESVDSKKYTDNSRNRKSRTSKSVNCEKTTSNENGSETSNLEGAPESKTSRTKKDGHRRLARRAWWFGVLAGVTFIVVVETACAAWAEPAGGIEQVKSFATKLTTYVTAIAASVAVLFMAVNGIRWTMSSGNPMRQAEAKNGLVSAAAGLAIALSAGVIVNLVVAALQ